MDTDLVEFLTESKSYVGHWVECEKGRRAHPITVCGRPIDIDVSKAALNAACGDDFWDVVLIVPFQKGRLVQDVRTRG